MKRIVVVGAGFGGLEATDDLDRMFRGDAGVTAEHPIEIVRRFEPAKTRPHYDDAFHNSTNLAQMQNAEDYDASPAPGLDARRFARMFQLSKGCPVSISFIVMHSSTG